MTSSCTISWFALARNLPLPSASRPSASPPTNRDIVQQPSSITNNYNYYSNKVLHEWEHCAKLHILRTHTVYRARNEPLPWLDLDLELITHHKLQQMTSYKIYIVLKLANVIPCSLILQTICLLLKDVSQNFFQPECVWRNANGNIFSIIANSYRFYTMTNSHDEFSRFFIIIDEFHGSCSTVTCLSKLFGCSV